MIGWETGKQWEPGTLSSASSDLEGRASTMDSVASGIKGASVGSWKGRAAQQAGLARRELGSSADLFDEPLEKAASAYSTAADSITSIQQSMDRLENEANSDNFSIVGMGVVVDNATIDIGLNPAKAARAAARKLKQAFLQAQVGVLVARLNAADQLLAMKLNAAKIGGNIRQIALQIGYAHLDWGLDRFHDLQDFAQNQIIDRAQAFATGAGRFWDAATDVPAWIKDIRHGQPPQLSEIAGHGLYLTGLYAGAGMNLWTGKDQHFFDDGTPFAGDPRLMGENFSMGGPADFMNFMRDAYPDGDDSPSIDVRVIERDGQVNYVVSVPGTVTGFGHNGWFGSSDALDWPANLKGIAYGDSTATQAVMEAIDGVRRERGDENVNVLLSGHSQGGIIAANIAANEEFRSNYNVEGLMAAGSPIETIPVPRDVNTLSVAASDDMVPMLDAGGRDIAGVPPLRDHMTEVILEPYGKDPITNHNQGNYADKLGADDMKSRYPQIGQWGDQMSNYQTREGDKTAHYRVEIGRDTGRGRP